MKATIVGGGLAGSEAAWALAERGIDVTLVEMRPVVKTEAHQTDRIGELVCSNSFKSVELENAHGLLKAELRDLGSILLPLADEARVPGGSALAVDREVFSQLVHDKVTSHPRITVVREEATAIPAPGIIATGPLTSQQLAKALSERLGGDALAFYDAIAPIVSHESLDHSQLYAKSRWDKGGGDDYLNAPLTREQYEAFIDALTGAEQFTGHAFDEVPYFEGCLPIEEMASRGRETLRFGPMKPIGLRDPKTGKRPHAVVQLRREDQHGQMWNLVGFQTRLRTGEQRRVFRMIPGLENAEFLRTGSIHRNTYLNFPARLTFYGAPIARPEVIVAGQLTGVEGYVESAASGILAGVNMDRMLRGLEPVVPPPTTMLGALFHYLRTAAPGEFQPMNSNFGLLAVLDEHVRDKKRRREMLAARDERALQEWMESNAVEPVAVGMSATPA